MSKIITLARLSDFLRNLKGLFVTKTDAESTYETKEDAATHLTKTDAANIYETKEDAATHLTDLNGLFVTKTDAKSTYETKANAANIYETKEDAATHLTKTEASKTYITKTDAESTYETKANAANIYETKEDAATHLTKTEASETYLTKADAANTYEGLFVTKTDAESTYETKANAANIYETKEDAATHLTKTEASKTYITKTDAESTYETKANAANIYETKEDAATHLTKTEASKTYLTKADAADIYEELFVTKTDAESTYETKANAANIYETKEDAAAHLTKTDAANIYETKEDAATHLTKTEASKTYLTKADAADIYEELFVTKTDAESTYETKEDAATHLTKTDAANIYETKANAATHLTKTDAANIYETKEDAATHLTKTEASETYITKADAADIYETKEDAAAYLTGTDAFKTYVTKKDATTYLTKTDASKTYITKADAADTYESKTDAATHLTKTEASETYITKADAADTYESKTDAATHLTKTEASETYITKADAADTYESKTDAATHLTKAEAADTYATKDELYGGKNYSIIIDFSLNDPASMITYTDDIDIDPMDTRWFDELGLKLCVLKDGIVQYYLDPDDVTKKLDGSAADITTIGNDVMLEIPRMGTYCSWLDSNHLKITITTAPNKTGYDYRAFSLHKYNDCDKIYIGRYHAYAENNKMYSSSGKAPMVEQTLAAFRTYATNRGTGYTDIGICDDILLQCLYLLIVRNFNSQSAVGRGICNGRYVRNTGAANTFGWLNTGSPNKTDDYTAVCCLGIENFWGNISVWEDGIIKTKDTNYVLMAQYSDQYNSDGTGYENVAQITYTDTSGKDRSHYQNGYMGRIAGIPKFIFMPNSSSVAASSRGESTYMCDWHHIQGNQLTIASFGGSWWDGSWAGAFFRRLGSAPSNYTDRVGSRLCFKKEASETYLTKADADDTYESKTDAATHLTKTEASETYITKADAADTYATKDELNRRIREGKSYSIIIDFSLSDPASMITYADDIDIAPMDTEWFDVLGLKLCVLKDGIVQYYLNPDDVTKKLDGSAADITTLGNDVMLEIPRMGTNCSWLDSDHLKITITTAPNKTGYDYRAFSLHKYNDCDKIYIGRYHACLDNNKMYSSSGKAPVVSKTLAAFRTYATNRGTGYTDIGICDDILLQCLYLLIVRNFNSQSAVGRGICNTSAKHNTGEANTFGWLNTGSLNKTDGNTAVCCLGIENFWGNIWVFEDGIIRNSNRQYFMAQYADQYNSDATGYEYIAQASPTETGYQGRCAGIPKFIFMPDASTVAASGRGESTYMCDYQNINETITVIAVFGGDWLDGSKVGAFPRNLYNPVSDASDAVGSRLCFKKIAEN